jgi:hypothetical protein
MKRYQNDPRWMTAKYAGKCGGNSGKCFEPIKAGDRVFYYPTSRTILAQACGHAEDASNDFAAHAADEDCY